MNAICITIYVEPPYFLDEGYTIIGQCAQSPIGGH